MQPIIFSIAAGIALGLSLAGPPGPVNAVMANEAIEAPRKGSLIGAGALSADAIMLVITYFFASEIPKYFINFFFLVGSFLMFYIAWQISKSKSRKSTLKGNYFLGLTMGVTNPFQIAWWLTAGLFMLTQFGGLYTILGLFTGIIIWVISFPLIVHKSKKYYSPSIIPKISAALLVVFGAYMLYSGIISLL